MILNRTRRHRRWRRRYHEGTDPGGTVFLDRGTLEAALARGHELALFNRGKQNAELFPGVEKLRGDRDGDLSALRGRRWDAVIDPSGYFPRLIRRAQ